MSQPPKPPSPPGALSQSPAPAAPLEPEPPAPKLPASVPTPPVTSPPQPESSSTPQLLTSQQNSHQTQPSCREQPPPNVVEQSQQIQKVIQPPQHNPPSFQQPQQINQTQHPQHPPPPPIQQPHPTTTTTTQQAAAPIIQPQPQPPPPINQPSPQPSQLLSQPPPPNPQQLKTTPQTTPKKRLLPHPPLTPHPHDVLCGRGASINSHPGNQQFRQWCFARKKDFEKSNPTQKRLIAKVIIQYVRDLNPPGRFLKRLRVVEQDEKEGPWVELNDERAMGKACQVMRDFMRVDKDMVWKLKGACAGDGLEFDEKGVIKSLITPHTNDVLSGRGAFVNAHPGNQTFRRLALERKTQFDAGSYADKRALAGDVVRMIRSLPGRFLKRIPLKGHPCPKGLDGHWVEMKEEKAINKACQVMRDCWRADRVDRDVRGILVKEVLEEEEEEEEEKKGDMVVVKREEEEESQDVTMTEDSAVTSKENVTLKPKVEEDTPAGI